MMSKKKTLLQFALLVVVALAAFVNILDNGFVYDDHEQILDNPWLRDPRHLVDIFSHEVWGFTTSSASDYYRPFMHSLNLLVYSLFGPNRVAFHLANLVLHIGCSLLFFLICRKLVSKDALTPTKSDTNLPLMAGLLFAAYPANTEAVAWLGSSADLLYVFFCLAAWWCWLKSTLPGKPLRYVSYGCALGFFFAATLSKETAFLFPVLLVVVDAAQGRFVAAGLWPRIRRCYLPLAGVAVLSLLLRFAVLGTVTPVAHDLQVDVFALLSAFAWYLRHLFWPFQHNFYPDLPTLAADGLFVASLLPLLVLIFCVALIVLLRRVRILWVALGLIVLPLLPALANSALGMPVAERYLYLPGAGFCLFLAWLVCRFVNGPRLRIAVIILLLIVFSAGSITRNAQFQNDLTIWHDTVQKNPRSVKALSWYATALLARGRLDEGIERTLEAIELGLKSGNSLYDLALALDKNGRGQETTRIFDRVLQLHPDDDEAFFEVGRTFYLLGEYELAKLTLERSMELKANDPLTLIVLGRVLVQLGENSRALSLFEQAVQLDANQYPTLMAEMTSLSQKLAEQ